MEDGENEIPAEGSPPEDEASYHDPWLGQYLGDYYLIRRIGEGGMGVIYLARDQSLDRLAAVKFLAAHMVSDKDYIERFFKEARGAAKLNHPNIIPVYDAGTLDGDIYYFIMEYIEGRDLGSLLRELKVFPVANAVEYMRQAASALGYAHKKNIIHRDIKPDNFLLTNEGIIKVGDLGLAKWVGDEISGAMTQTGVVMGTPFYISPEQVRGARDVDPRADIYSLGATLYHLVTGKLPYEGSTSAVVMAMHLHHPVPEPELQNPLLDPAICAIIKRMMAKNPEDRFQSMEEVEAIFTDYLAGKVIPAHILPNVQAEPQQLPHELEQAVPTAPMVSQSQLPKPKGIPSIVGVTIIISVAIISCFASYFTCVRHIFKSDKEAPSETKQVETVVETPKAMEIKIPTEIPKQPLKSEVVPQPLPPSSESSKEVAAVEPPRMAPPPPKTAEEQNVLPPSAKETVSQPSLPSKEAVPAPAKKREFEMEYVIPQEAGGWIEPPWLREQMTLAAFGPSFEYFQDFSKYKPGKLPGDVQCFVVDATGKREVIDRPNQRFKRVKMGREILPDEVESGKNLLRIWLDNDKESQLFTGVRFTVPHLEKRKMCFLSMLIRLKQKKEAVIWFGIPDSEKRPVSYFTVSDNWRYCIVFIPPDMQRSVDSNISIGFMGDGQLDIGGVKIDEVPDSLKLMIANAEGVPLRLKKMMLNELPRGPKRDGPGRR